MLKKKYKTSHILYVLHFKTSLIEFLFYIGMTLEEYLKNISHVIMKFSSFEEKIPNKEII